MEAALSLEVQVSSQRAHHAQRAHDAQRACHAQQAQVWKGLLESCAQDSSLCGNFRTRT